MAMAMARTTPLHRHLRSSLHLFPWVHHLHRPAISSLSSPSSSSSASSSSSLSPSSSSTPSRLCFAAAFASRAIEPPSSLRSSETEQQAAVKAASNRFPYPISLVSGASRGLGFEFTCQILASHPDSPVIATCRNPNTAHNLMALKEKYPTQLTVRKLDVTDERTAEDVAREISDRYGRLDLYINTVGILHNSEGMQPERKVDELTQENAMLSYKTNAVGPTIVAKHMLPLLRLGKGEGTGRDGAVLAHLSAKVGSIDDNKIGGWYSYRASKAGLNQLTRTIGLECLQRKEPIIVVVLHPGTVDTDLSKPFSRNVKADKLFTPSHSVKKLLGVIDSLKLEDSAKFFNYDKVELPW